MEACTGTPYLAVSEQVEEPSSEAAPSSVVAPSEGQHDVLEVMLVLPSWLVALLAPLS